jgi:flagellar hook-basal body complex protein FliE
LNPPIAPLDVVGMDAAVPQTLQTPASQPTTQFGNWFTQELDAVNTQMVNAERSVQQLASGATTNVHDTMIQLEQARLSFQLAMQVRSRILEAYQEIMRMQV